MRQSNGRGREPDVPKLVIAVGAVVAVVVLDVLGLFNGAGAVMVGLFALVATVVGVRMHRPSRSWPWWMIAGALSLFIAGAIARNAMHTLANLGPTRPLVPDIIVLPGYALLAIGLLGFSRGSGGRHRFGITLDGTIAALSILACAWVFVIDPVLFTHQTPMASRLALSAYPPASIFLVVITLRIAFSPVQERVASYWFLLIAMTSMFIGDTLYMFVDIDIAHVPTQLLVLPYCIAFLAAGATALDPSMRMLTEPRDTYARTSGARIIITAVALAIPAFLTLQVRRETISDRLVLFGILIALTAAAVIRIVEALRTAERSEASLAYQASHDMLTGLPNRRMMREHLSQALAHASVDDTQVGLLFIDLDRFKLINDTLGHSEGDELLIEVARRLQDHVRPDDLVTRIGGDEFMIVLGRVVSVSQAMDLANRLRSALRAPFEINGVEFYVSASIGLAFASGDDADADAEALVRDADTAMYQAKDAGRDSVAIFDKSMRVQVTERVELEHELRHAVARGQFQLVYQPIVRLPQGPIVGVEALIRWSHPTLGVISPVKFIPLAEESGIITEIGEWVLDQALGQLDAWRRQVPGLRDDFYVGVNLSAVQLRDKGLTDTVDRMLAKHDVEGRALCLEVTESAAMRDPNAAASILHSLRGLDVRLAIDDFGTEYSSLAYLQRFPVDSLKIDRSFITSLDADDSADATLVAAIVAMARALGISTIAEGVETHKQAMHLIDLDCDAVQGYLYSRPVRAEQIPYLVSSLGKNAIAALSPIA